MTKRDKVWLFLTHFSCEDAFTVTSYFIGNKNKVVSKGALAEHLNGDLADMFDNYDFLYSHIKNLRAKLFEATSCDYIKTIYGIGYKWPE